MVKGRLCTAWRLGRLKKMEICQIEQSKQNQMHYRCYNHVETVNLSCSLGSWKLDPYWPPAPLEAESVSAGGVDIAITLIWASN
jgi:hypothetical protein